jgi:MoaA/NifB/PqqE/SkfB family radical SAM enzyme
VFWLPFLSRPPRFDWLQVEVTTACPAACLYCPRTVQGPAWPEHFLPPDLFARLRPALRQARYLHLQGWGEPLLHPEFFRFVREAKEAGCRVGFTTNGMLCSEAVLRLCLEEGLDLVALSLAGTDPSQDQVRRGTSCAQVLAALRTLAELKAARKAAIPRVHLAYMLLASRLMDLERLPALLKGLGVEEVVINTLDYVAAPELAREVVRPTPEVAARLARVREQAAREGVQVHCRLPAPRPAGPCPENPVRALVVGADGGVSPCVFAALPETAESDPRPHRLSFGSLRDDDLLTIWESPAYREFRQEHARGRPSGLCRTCSRRRTAVI